MRFDSLANISVKRVSAGRFQQEIEDNQVSGWSLKSQNDNVAIMTKPGSWGSLGGHIIVALLTVWWTFFIGNILYALYVHFTSNSELQIKVDLSPVKVDSSPVKVDSSPVKVDSSPVEPTEQNMEK